MSPTTFIQNIALGGGLTVDQIASQLDLVERELVRQVTSRVPLVEGAGALTLKAGGKRLRPALCLACSFAAGGGIDSRAVPIAASLEMVHMATLIHDDVIDEASTRRGEPTAAAACGNTGSILAGDVLLAKAMMILALDGDLDLIRLVASSVVEMAEGEAREVESRGIFDLPLETHLGTLRQKTASFIDACCQAGAVLARADALTQERLGSFGHHLGMAFQIQDDVLDYRGDRSKTGKPRATDFREGCGTLPLIYLLPHLSTTEREFVKSRFGQEASEGDILLITSWMVERGTLGKADAEARRHVHSALEALEPLPSSRAKTILEGIAAFAVEREA